MLCRGHSIRKKVAWKLDAPFPNDLFRPAFSAALFSARRCFYPWIFILCSIFTNAGSLWSTISLCPKSNWAIFCISSSLRAKSQIAKFCSMRSLCTDFGITTTPLCTFQRNATCAAVFPYFSPMAVSTGWVKMPCFPSAKGPHASGTTQYSFIRAKAFSCWKNGCSSI